MIGTDFLGRDMFVRTIKGLSLSLAVGSAASAVSAVIALIVGVTAALGRGMIDHAVNWIIDLFMSVPHTVLLILISIALNRGAMGLLIGIAVIHWTSLARIARKALEKYGLNQSAEKLYPFELSGGMARRVLVATAAVSNAKVIIADEPTPGLSAELAESAMARFRQLADNGTGVLLITHDLELAVRYADRISVFYAGTTLETANASDFEKEELLLHPYSRALWRAMPQHGFIPTPGTQPYVSVLPGRWAKNPFYYSG